MASYIERRKFLAALVGGAAVAARAAGSNAGRRIYRSRASRRYAVVSWQCYQGLLPRLELATEVGLRNSVHTTQGVVAS
jgi:hypothetical protein